MLSLDSHCCFFPHRLGDHHLNLSRRQNPDGCLLVSLLHFQPQTDVDLLFPGSDLYGEESKNQFFVFDLRSDVCGCGEWKGLWDHLRTARFGVNCCIAWDTSLQAAGPVPPIHAPLVPLDADCRCTQLSDIHHPHLGSSLLPHHLQHALKGVRGLCQMGFSLFPRWGCQFFMLQVMVCTRASVWSKADNSLAEAPRCEAREQSVPRSIPCSMYGCKSMLGLGRNSNRKAGSALRLGSAFLENTGC